MISKNAVALLFLAASWLGLDIAETEIQEFIAAMVQVISFLVLLWNQIDRKNIKWFFLKKK